MSPSLEGLLSTVPEAPNGAGPEWLAGLRREAASLLHREGFPGKKHERWRFTSLRDVVSTAFSTHPLPAGLAVDGLSPGVTAMPLAEVLAREPASLEHVLGRIAPPEPFAALNAALFHEGIVVRIARGAQPKEPIRITHLARGGASPTASYPRVVVIAEPQSEATLIESYLAYEGAGKHLTNVVTEVSLGEGARLDHTRATHGTAGELHLAHLAVRQERDSRYVSHVVALGGALSRLEIDLSFAGEGAEADLDGVYHVDGTEHVDHHVRVQHATGHCTSRVRYRGLLDGKGHAVFDAIGIVHKGANGSSAHQENRNLLLSDDAIIDTKPHLEIETDDVRASHGTAIGAVDDRQLFYLRARGIPESHAREMLTFAFVRALIERIPHDDTVAELSDAVLRRLSSTRRKEPSS